jgi:hypothetical protein
MDEVAAIQDDFVGKDRRQGSRKAHPISLGSAKDRGRATREVGAVQGETRKESCIECSGYATKPATLVAGLVVWVGETTIGRDSFLSPAGRPNSTPARRMDSAHLGSATLFFGETMGRPNCLLPTVPRRE